MKIAEFFAELGFKIDGLKSVERAEQILEDAKLKAQALVEEVAALTTASMEAEKATKAFEAGTKESNAAGANAASITEDLAVKRIELERAEKAVQEATKNVGKQTKQTTSHLHQMTVKTAKAAVVVNGLNLAFIGLMKTAAKAGTLYQKFTVQTGLSSQQLQQWQMAAEKAGASAGEMEQAIKGIQGQQAQIAMGGGDISAFQFFGIDPREKDPFTVLAKLKERLKDFSDANIGFARERATAMGVDDNLFYALRSETFDLTALSQALVLTTEEQKNLNAVTSTWAGLMFSVASLKNRFLAGFATPVNVLGKVLQFATNALAGFVDWLNKGGLVATAVRWSLWAIVGLLGVVGVALAGLTAGLGVAAAAWMLYASGAFAAAGATLAAIAPFLPLIAAIAATLLILDDLWAEFQGGESVLGDFFKWFHQPVDALAAGLEGIIALVDLLTGHFDSAKDHFDEMKKDIMHMGSLGYDKEANFEGGGGDFGRHGAGGSWEDNSAALDTKKGAATLSENPNKSEAVAKGVLDSWSNLGNAISRIFGGGSSEGDKSGAPVAAMMRDRAGTPNVTHSTINTVRQTNDIDVHVDGSGSPRETGRAVVGSLKDQISLSNYQMPAHNY